ncbi:hypothetical protein ACFQV2_20470 [Actinokineospora soli]|uniref:Tetratricopeptide repeat-containing protein n=1 Tax=Actinokineospora soli TaxID=1048753 RepID=A0ABW2TQK3_9PSEU
MQTGDSHFAQVAVDHGLAELSAHRDSPGWFAVVGQYGDVLLRSGSYAEARRLAVDTAAALARTAPDQHTALLRLHLIGAEAAAVLKDHRDAHASLDKAREAVPADLWPGVVDIAGVRVELALGRVDQALRLAGGIEGVPTMCRMTQSAHYLTLAEAHLANRDLIATTFALMQAERVCAEDIRFAVAAREIVTEALTHNSASVRHELSVLAERAGIL